MGRAQGQTNNAAAAAVGAGRGRRKPRKVQATTRTIAVSDFIAGDLQFAREGEEIALRDGLTAEGERAPRSFTVEIGDPAAAIKGLDNVKDVQALPGGNLFHVTFHDGESAMVDLAQRQVAFASGDDHAASDVYGALYAAMGHQALFATDPATADPNDPNNELGDAFSALHESDVAPSVEQLAEVAFAAQARLEAEGGDIEVNPDALVQMMAPHGPNSDRAAQRLAMARWRETVQGIIANAEQEGVDADHQVALGLLFHTDPATGQPIGTPTQEMLEEYAAAAARLGHKIPELKIAYDKKGFSIGDFEVGAAEKERIDIIRNALSYGDRTFIFRGPPGSGKDAMAEQIAAILKCPMVPINLGASTDLEMSIGGDGLKHVEVIVHDPVRGPSGKFMGLVETSKGKFEQQELEPFTDTQGHVEQDENGNWMLNDGKGGKVQALTVERREIVPSSQTIIGPLAAAVQEPALVRLSEPRNMDPDSQRLNATIGDGIGEPGTRYINVNSSASGEERRISIPVHKDCIIVFSMNPGKEDNKLHSSTHDRAVNLDFDYPTREAECRRLAKIVNRIMRDETNTIPPELRREWPPETFEPIVGVVEKLRNAARDDAAFIDEPGARTAARLFLQLAMQAYNGDNRGDRTARLVLDFCRSYEEKSTTAPDSKVNQILSDELPALQKLNDALFNEGAKERGEEPLDTGDSK